MPYAPLPANKSSTRASRTKSPNAENAASRTKSIEGRKSCGGIFSRIPPADPAITRISAVGWRSEPLGAVRCRLLLLAIKPEDLSQKFAPVADDPVDEIGLRFWHGAGHLKINVTTVAVHRLLEVVLQLARDLLREEVTQRQPAVEVQFLSRLDSPRQIYFAVFRDQLQRVHFDILSDHAEV